jgi:hypothetical protein
MGLLGRVLSPPLALAGLAARLGRDGGALATDITGRSALAVLDVLLASPHTDEAVRRVLASGALDRALDEALGGPLVDALARDLVRHGVPERIAGELIANGVVEEVLQSPALDRAVDQAMETHLLDAVVGRLHESDELWALVTEIAESTAVTDAIGRQGVGFAGQVAGQVRDESQRADEGLERVARRLLRRPSRPVG